MIVNCRTVRRYLSPYLDSELGPTETFDFAEHLRVCPGCAARVEAERGVERMVADSLRGVPMPPVVWSGIQRSIRVSARRRKLALPAFGLAAAALLALAAWFVPGGSTDVPTIAVALQQRFQATSTGAEFPVFWSGSSEIPIPGTPLHLMIPKDVVGHALAIAQVSSVVEDGVESIEVRLNCCGLPLLLRLTPTPNAMLAASPRAETVNGVNVASRSLEGFVVSGVSRHPISPLIAMVSVR